MFNPHFIGKSSAVLGVFIGSALFFALESQTTTPPPAPSAPPQTFEVRVIGRVEKSEKRAAIVLDKKYQPGLQGLNEFSHVWVFWWFDKNDTPQQRSILRVHPRGKPENPMTGVFATRSPVRPNLIAFSLCKIKSVKENEVEVEDIDAFPGTPVLDLKPYARGLDSAEATGPQRMNER